MRWLMDNREMRRLGQLLFVASVIAAGVAPEVASANNVPSAPATCDAPVAPATVSGAPTMDADGTGIISRVDRADGSVELRVAVDGDAVAQQGAESCASVNGGAPVASATVASSAPEASERQNQTEHRRSGHRSVIVIIVHQGSGHEVCIWWRGHGVEFFVTDRTEHSGRTWLPWKHWCSSPTPPPDIPEVPAPAMLGISGAAVFVAVSATRRRRLRTAR